MSPGIVDSPRLAHQRAKGVLLSLPPTAGLQLQVHTSVLTGCWEQKSGHHACTSALLTEPPWVPHTPFHLSWHPPACGGQGACNAHKCPNSCPLAELLDIRGARAMFRSSNIVNITSSRVCFHSVSRDCVLSTKGMYCALCSGVLPGGQRVHRVFARAW